MTLMSPGTNRPTAPSISDEVEAKLRLLNCTAVFQPEWRSWIIMVNGETAKGWTHPLWHSNWDETLTKIAEDRRLNTVAAFTTTEALAAQALLAATKKAGGK